MSRVIAAADRVNASAPGKMLIAGEYAVLRGAPAIVCAVQRRAEVSWTDDIGGLHVARGLEHDAPRYPETEASRQAAERYLGVTVPGALRVDVTALRSDDVKLGVGSSAAAAAAASMAVFLSAGQDPEQESVRRAVLECALAGHADVAPNGSGVDVAASVLGGTIRYTRAPLSTRSLSWPDDLTPVIVWTGKAASTREFLEKIAAFEARDKAAHDRAFAGLDAKTRDFCKAFEAGSGADVLTATKALVQGLAHLGEKSGAPIVESRLSQISALAEASGGAAKPSGAGGGDVAIGLFAGAESAQEFARAVSAAGFVVLEEAIGGAGASASAV